MAYKDQKQYRLPEYNYGVAGIYFVTICVKDRLSVLATLKTQNNDKNVVGTRRGVFLPNENPKPFELILSPIGEIVKHFWLEIPNRFSGTTLDEWVIMPDHVHGLIQLGNGLELFGNASSGKNAPRRVPTSTSEYIETTVGLQPLKRNSLSSIINHFKGNVKRWCNQNGFEDFCWQPCFYDHIVRNDQDLIRIQEYIRQNPERWMQKNNL